MHNSIGPRKIPFMESKICAKTAVAGLLAIFQSGAFAEAGWFDRVYVKELVVIWDGGVNVRTDPVTNSCVSRSGYGANYASIPPSHPGLNRMTSLLTTAMVTNRRVSLYFSDNNCTIAEMRLDPP